MSDKNSGEVILAFILGAVVGGVLGMLYAPAPGKETRKKLHELSDELAEKMEDIEGEVKSKTKEIVEEGRGKIHSTKERIENAFEAGRKAFDKKS
ncbi:MAG: YtxH domain-containing protein [Endomicrobiales bacterium]|nr:YtxH domain-containing protein [Endomicrobiales bacterium]